MGPIVDTPFVPFGQQHLAALAISLGAVAGLVALVRATKHAGTTRRLAVALACALVLSEAFKLWFRAWLYGQPAGQFLPLHLCGASALLMAWVLWFRSYGGFEVGYFWGMAGSMQALLTPDLPVGFPSLAFIGFFLGHGLVILAVVFAIAAYGFQPTLRSVGKAIAATIAYMAVIAPLNYPLDANYLYLRHKPDQPSIIDFLGPWPWYVGSLLLVRSAPCLLYYLPFAAWRRLRHDGG